MNVFWMQAQVKLPSRRAILCTTCTTLLIFCVFGKRVPLQALLVPYFAWQRSHAVHHSRTNHVTEGETHVPALAEEAESKFTFKLRDGMGDGPFALVHTLIVLAFGWPVYLLTGASGGPVRGKTNHFWPFAGATGRHALFPGGWKDKVCSAWFI